MIMSLDGKIPFQHMVLLHVMDLLQFLSLKVLKV